MAWIRLYYERVVLVAAAILLFFCAISIWRNAVLFGNDFAGRQTEPQLKNASPPRKAVELGHAAEKLQQPSQWTSRDRAGLFVPEKHFIDANGLPTTLKTTEVHPPVPNDWLEQFGLPIVDADVLEQDPDGDGFTNLEEWQGHTNPIEKSSHPDYLTKLKVKALNEEPFRFMFSSSVGSSYAINTIDGSAPTQFLKIGDMIAGSRFKIVKFTPKKDRNQYGTTVDVSELTLEQEDTKEQLTLTKEKVEMSPESVVTFIYSWPANAAPKEFEVRKDQEFSLQPVQEIKYKVVDVQPYKAVIINTQAPNEPIEIGMLSP